MYSPIFPKLHGWYRLPDFEIFRVTGIGADKVQIQYPDGVFETVEMDIWHKLRAMMIDEPEKELGAEQEIPAIEPDFLTLGVAPGTEGLDYADLFFGYE